MSADAWLDIGGAVLATIFVVFVAIGAVPAFTMAYQFLIVPLHARFNHYEKAAPYLPNVAVVVPAWNEGAVIGGSIDRLMALEYPPERLRVYVVDDASTDDTPDVVLERAARYPGRVFHLRREKGGEGKAHTLNHGLRRVLSEDWMQALLIMDADVIYLPDSMRKMTRHLADPEVGSVTAYISEGSLRKNYLTRFIAFEYVLSQVGSRRAQNVLGALACLAGGAQLHSRENLLAIGGQIDTSSLAEDTVTTFETQLSGRKVVFEPHAVVLAEEPRHVGDLWKQRLRWARGNVQLTKRYSHLWFRPSKEHKLGTISFGLFWFSVFLLPVLMLLSSVGLIGLYLMDSPLAMLVFRALWIVVGCAYVYIMLFAAQLDPKVGRVAWREVLLFPGLISMVVLLAAFFPGLFEQRIPAMFGLTLTEGGYDAWNLAIFAWISLCMVAAWGMKLIDSTKFGRVVNPILVYLIGYGPILCAVTFDSYIKEARGAAMTWDKTEKSGAVLA
ncbi:MULTISPECIES: glycosyltransferase [unclassified Pseudoclavibacter]|uniref:glycosyltransferase n=1 Tax=unclassified Pseudoclavibacter TaxID=2615177 RepID=UPI0012F2E1EF|nr:MULTISPECIES: glycosyltransferase [unclassified Pseudoclavibacter]VXC46394.1 Glucosaminyltransferase [Pseudoclavibacter sp. 8L]